MRADLRLPGLWYEYTFRDDGMKLWSEMGFMYVHFQHDRCTNVQNAGRAAVILIYKPL